MPTQTAPSVNDLEVKFERAVELVRSLPQKGPFQPSYNDASKVYGYYKQANCGPCRNSRPAFWDVVGRAKWDAWNVLGDMSKQEAMENYVNEIKKLFERLTTLEEFQETQKSFSAAIIPFCESTGLELPAALTEIKCQEKKIEEKKKIKGLEKSSGLENRGSFQGAQNNGDIVVDDNDDNIKLVQVVRTIPRNGDVMHERSLNGDNGHNGSSVNSVSDRTSEDERDNHATKAVQIEMSSFIDAESSDDDIYCDSVNPDEISVPGVSAQSTNEDHITSDLIENELTKVTQDSLLLNMDSQYKFDGTDLVVNPTQSTPAVKMRPLGQVDASCPNGAEYRKLAFINASVDNQTDTSTLSSLSADINGDHTIDTSKSMSGRLEEELKHEFESKWSRRSRKGKSGRHRNRDAGRGSTDDERQHRDDIGRRDLVVGARGNSQTDLAGNGAGGRTGREETRAEQPTADSSRQTEGHSVQRLRRANADSSSDSNESSRSSATSGETIGEQIVKALGRLEHDMRLVLLRLDSIENRISTVSDAVNRRPWWAAYLPSRRLVFLLLWPVLVNILLFYWRRKRRK